MLKTFNDRNQLKGRSNCQRFTCMSAGQSSATELLRSCPVVTANGQAMGRVRSVMVDVRSRQLRYVIVAPNNSKATVIIPWQALYFDSELVRLVYYTFS